ncbi:MAG: hypothetical protein GX442_12825 [Candidatus Riflebacteria bacterium]|nr:hypothetical protein [Candidatus Riflebacteria bacterium]
MLAFHGTRRGISILLVVVLVLQFFALPPLQAENKAARSVAGGVVGFLAGAVAMTALGVGGLAVVAGCVAGVYIGKWVGKNWNSFFKARKQEVKAVGTAVVNTSAAAAQRLAEQEAKAAQFIDQLTGQNTSPAGGGAAVTPEQIEAAASKYQAAYKAYNEAVQRGDNAAAQKFGLEYRTLQAEYQNLLKGQGR